uniref:Cyclin N-terminal domain-containing protein n=1 Tax=Syphacia muris TaxID=451379 RepID=A0A0N5AKZ8_9BILA
MADISAELHNLSSYSSDSLHPQFCNNLFALPSDLSVDWLSYLCAENLSRIAEANEYKKLFLNAPTTQFIFTVCVRLRLPQEVKYSAALIFEAFMLKHVEELYAYVYNTECSERKKYREWERVEATVSRQITLRILSSIQIASKLHNYHESLSRKAVQVCLKSIGYAYTEDAVMKSELRLLSSLNWNLYHLCMPTVYLETLLKLLIERLNVRGDTNNYWQYALLVMDCVFLFWDDIFKRMLSNVLGIPTKNISKERYCRVEADWILLSTGIIATAVSCSGGMEAADKVIVHLQNICGTPLSDITDMCVAIMESVLEHKSNFELSSGMSTSSQLIH